MICVYNSAKKYPVTLYVVVTVLHLRREVMFGSLLFSALTSCMRQSVRICWLAAYHRAGSDDKSYVNW